MVERGAFVSDIPQRTINMGWFDLHQASFLCVKIRRIYGGLTFGVLHIFILINISECLISLLNKRVRTHKVNPGTLVSIWMYGMV